MSVPKSHWGPNAFIVIQRYITSCSACNTQNPAGYPRQCANSDCNAKFIAIVRAPDASPVTVACFAEILPIVNMHEIPAYMASSLLPSKYQPKEINIPQGPSMD